MSVLLVDILEGFLGEVRKHNEDTGQISFDCPACSYEKNMFDGDGKGNLEINYNRSVFHCWSCGEVNHMQGPVTKLIKKYGSPKNLRDYLLLKPDADIMVGKERTEIIVELPESYKKISECTSKNFRYDMAMSYLRERGITDDIIKEFDIGYTIKGKHFNRIIIPSYDSEGKLNYFIARWFAREKTKLKYLNPDVEKQEIIFNEGKINWDATIYLVEGVTDHIVVPNSIPMLGKYISPLLLEMIYDKSTANIVILLDDDALKDAIHLYKQINFGDLHDRVRICIPPEGYDPSKIFEKYGPKGIVNLLRTSRKLNYDEL
jgi:DNA primase